MGVLFYRCMHVVCLCTGVVFYCCCVDQNRCKLWHGWLITVLCFSVTVWDACRLFYWLSCGVVSVYWLTVLVVWDEKRCKLWYVFLLLSLYECMVYCCMDVCLYGCSCMLFVLYGMDVLYGCIA